MRFLYPAPSQKVWEFLLVTAVCVGVVWAVTQHVTRNDADQLLATARQVAAAYQDSLDIQRDITDSLIARAAANERLTALMRRRLANRGVELDSALSTATAVLEDSLATTAELRQQLDALTSVALGYKYAAEQYAVTVDSLLVKHLAERQAWIQERTYTVHTLAAKDSVIVALEAKRCRLLFFSCPSRVVSATLGGAAVLVAVLVVTASIP